MYPRLNQANVYSCVLRFFSISLVSPAQFFVATFCSVHPLLIAGFHGYSVGPLSFPFYSYFFLHFPFPSPSPHSPRLILSSFLASLLFIVDSPELHKHLLTDLCVPGILLRTADAVIA